MLPGIAGNAFPEQAKNDEIAVLGMYTGAAQFNDLGTLRLKCFKRKFLRAIITQMDRCISAGLKSVSADDAGRGQMFYHEMIANGVERVLVQASQVRLFKPLIEFKIENLKTQTLRGANIVPVP